MFCKSHLSDRAFGVIQKGKMKADVKWETTNSFFFIFLYPATQ